MTTDPNDPRWGGYAPWFLRHSNFSGPSDFQTFFSRLSQRLERLFKFNECNVHLTHFGPCLETESLQRFRYDPRKTLDANCLHYFSPEALESVAAACAWDDKEEQEARGAEEGVRKLDIVLNPPYIGPSGRGPTLEVKDRAKAGRDLAEWKVQAETLRARAQTTWEHRKRRHYIVTVNERIGVLECLLRVLPKQTPWHAALIQDIRRFFAESEILLDVRTDEDMPPRIIPMDEPLLQAEVVDKLLPRLFEKFPERARELMNAYHDLLGGKDGDSIFVEAFKTLEQLARDMTGDTGFVFDQRHLDKHFPLLHGTIHQTVIRLAGHRGDQGGHGKNAPLPHEIRYLLFAICNAALLLLDYPAKSGEA